MNKYSVITPHAAFLVWNYANRMGNEPTKDEDVNRTEQLIISTMSLKSISTSKSKSSPNGTFEIRLAPTKNWVQLLTPNSWCAVLMGREKLKREDIDYSNPKAKANPKNIKMIGRIASVRINVTVDQATGARNTEYVVTGQDWGSIFNSTLLVDPAMAMDAKNNDLPFGYLSQLIYNEYNKSQLGTGVKSTYENIKVILSMWGAKEVSADKDFIAKPEVTFSMPTEFVKFFGFKSESGKSTTSVADLIHIYHGALNKLGDDPYEDSYDNYEESYQLIGDEILNQSTVWPLIMATTNPWINELICDLRWENGEPKLALYKRIKPFIIDKTRLKKYKVYVGDDRTPEVNKEFDKNISEFKNIRRIEIPLNEVLAFNAGTDGSNRVNFVEIKPINPMLSGTVEPLLRLKSQFYDKKSFSREGVKPFNVKTGAVPREVLEPVLKESETKEEKKKDSTEAKTKAKKREQALVSKKNTDKNIDKKYAEKNINALTNWKYLVKEWYFDIHKMLNGSIVFMGQDKYIQVGDNIIVDAKIFGIGENLNTDQIRNRGKAYLLLHVENIHHSFTVNNNGARHFTTTVNFVRGILVDKNGNEFKSAKGVGGTLDQDVTKLSLTDELIYQTVTTKTEMDPD